MLLRLALTVTVGAVFISPIIIEGKGWLLKVKVSL
jgi:hypothetical protein